MTPTCLVILFAAIFGSTFAAPNKEFIEAIERNDIDFVQNFLKQNPNVDLEHPTENGTVALHHAETIQMQQVLLGHGANINAQTEFGFSILHIAVSFAAHKMRDFLLEQNIQVDLEDIDGRTALFNAIAANDLESSRALVNAGGSCLHLDSQSVCPLQIAVSTGNLQIVEFILNCSKSLINHQNEFGFSVLHTLALFPSKDTEEILKLLILNGADKDLRDESGNSAEDLADIKEHFATARMIRYYDLTNSANSSYAALPILSELTTESTSQIQGYVNYVLGLSNFTEITAPEVQQVSKDLWEEDFGMADQHLHRAQNNGIEWNISVYPSIKSLYSDLGNFRSTYLSGFEEIQPSLRSLESGQVDEDYINEQIELEEMLWAAQGYSRSRITLLKNRLRKKLEQESSDYSKGLKDILTLLDYTKTQSEIYQNKSNETLNILTNFKKNLIIDRSNFQSDRDFLQNATTIEQSKLVEVNANWTKLKEREDLKTDEVDDILKKMDEALKQTKAVLTANVVVSGLESATLLSYGGIYQRQKVLENRATSRLAKINKFKRQGIRLSSNWKVDGIKYKDNPLKQQTWRNRLNKVIRVNAKTGIDLGRLTKMQKTAAKWSNIQSKIASKLRFASGAFAVLGFGFGIFSLVQFTQSQDEAAERQEKLKELEKELEGIQEKMDSIVKMIEAVSLTSASKTEAEFRLDFLSVKLDNAINEASQLTDLWQNIHSEVVELENDAILGINSSANEQLDKFTNLMKALRKIEENWLSIDDFALQISNTFYTEEIDADLDE